jgi:hypothetical protein
MLGRLIVLIRSAGEVAASATPALNDLASSSKAAGEAISEVLGDGDVREAIKGIQSEMTALRSAMERDPLIETLEAQLKVIEDRRRSLTDRNAPSLESRTSDLAVRDAEERQREIARRLREIADAGISSTVIRRKTDALRKESDRLREELPKLREQAAALKEQEKEDDQSAERKAIELERLAIEEEKLKASLDAQKERYQRELESLEKRQKAEQQRLDDMTRATDERLAKLKETSESVAVLVEDSLPAADDAVEKLTARMRLSAQTTVDEIAASVVTKVAETMESARENVEQTAVAMEERIGRIFDDAFTHEGLPLEEWLTGQRDRIREIEETPFGGMLDQWVKAFEYIERVGSTKIDPRKLFDLELDMKAFEELIRKYTGEAGRNFSFEQLRREIRDLVKAQKEAQRTAQRNGSRPSSRGSTGFEKPNSGCNGQPTTASPSVLIRTGGLR